MAFRFDASAGVYSIDICLRVSDEDEGEGLLGVFKAVMNIREVLEVVDRGSSDNLLILFKRKYQIIRKSGSDAAIWRDGSAYVGNVQFAPGATETTTNQIV